MTPPPLPLGQPDELSPLIAVAAAAARDQLGLHAGQVKVDRAAEHDLQVLERDRLDMAAVQVPQRGRCRLQRAAVTGAVQVGAEIQLG
jgi:hypothetical protein